MNQNSVNTAKMKGYGVSEERRNKADTWCIVSKGGVIVSPGDFPVGSYWD